ncbi:Ankyrin-3 [Phlyctochytrium bullatum]|nr:Ankyrin-3 [Phlyctochytrium bullatum]
MLSHIVPVEVARSITIHLHPEWLPNLLAASRAVRRLFTPDESELPFVRHHFRNLFREVTSFRRSAQDIPFRKLPDVYAVGWFATCFDCLVGRVSKVSIIEAVVVVFPDLDHENGRLHFRLGPHRPIAWMEKIILKALECNILRKHSGQVMLVGKLASLLDSVAIVESALCKIFPTEMYSKDTADGADEVVMTFSMVDTSRPRNGVRDAFALFMHPRVPVAFNFSHKLIYHQTREYEFLINFASKGGRMHVVHYLLGNPLPLAPPPASRPIRPAAGNPPGSNHGGLEARRASKISFSFENPIASLTQPGKDHELPLQSLLRVQGNVPLCAVSYFLEQGAPINREGPACSGPIHRATDHGRVEIVRLLIERGANVDDRTFDGHTPLHVAARMNHAELTNELLAFGANRDAVVESLDADVPPEDDLAGPERGWTSLKVALDRGNYDVARVLLRAGGTLLVKAEDGQEVHIGDELHKKLLRV